MSRSQGPCSRLCGRSTRFRRGSRPALPSGRALARLGSPMVRCPDLLLAISSPLLGADNEFQTAENNSGSHTSRYDAKCSPQIISVGEVLKLNQVRLSDGGIRSLLIAPPSYRE